jgi:hypothetical protein
MRFATDGSLLYAKPASAALAGRLQLSIAQDDPATLVTQVLRSASVEPGKAVVVDVDGRSYLVRAIDVPDFGFVNVYATEIAQETSGTDRAP